MRDWGVILGGLIVWALHFLLIYGLASIVDILDPTPRRFWLIAGPVSTGLSLAALAWIGYQARNTTPLVRLLGIGGCAIAGVAVVFQSLPFVIAAA
jgi:hypothetical protein